jgi:hypothetical protein
MDKKMWFRSRYKPWHIDSCVSTMWIRMKMVRSPVTASSRAGSDEASIITEPIKETSGAKQTPHLVRRTAAWGLIGKKEDGIRFHPHHTVNLPLEVTIIHSYPGLYWESNGYDLISVRVSLKQLMNMPQDTSAGSSSHEPDDGWSPVSATSYILSNLLTITQYIALH